MSSETELVWTSEDKIGGTLPCIICGRVLESSLPNEERFEFTTSNQPYAGTSFTSHGHYGSTVYDSMHQGIYIELNICDPCIRERYDSIREVIVVPQSSKVTRQRWNPNEN